RRHTIFSRDWSSDVCSSDLHADDGEEPGDDSLRAGALPRLLRGDAVDLEQDGRAPRTVRERPGRARCRERHRGACIGPGEPDLAEDRDPGYIRDDPAADGGGVTATR